MRCTKEAVYLAPAIAGRIAEFRNDGDLAPFCVVEHVDSSAATASIRYQESDNGQDWTDISGTAASVNQGKSNAQEVVTTRSRIALWASGNVKLLFTLSKQVDGSPDDLGTA